MSNQTLKQITCPLCDGDRIMVLVTHDDDGEMVTTSYQCPRCHGTGVIRGWCCETCGQWVDRVDISDLVRDALGDE